MKKIFAIIALAGALLNVHAQGKLKIGHINSNDLLMVMPERAAAEKALQQEAQKLEEQLKVMTTEYQNKVADFQANAATMSELIKQTKAQEIGDLEKRIQEFQASAQETLQKKEQELLEPIIEKARKAIEDVAKENGYTYILDTGTGAVLYQPESDDILPLVKQKLGIQ
jgi:outer membrane protein